MVYDVVFLIVFKSIPGVFIIVQLMYGIVVFLKLSVYFLKLLIVAIVGSCQINYNNNY